MSHPGHNAPSDRTLPLSESLVKFYPENSVTYLRSEGIMLFSGPGFGPRFLLLPPHLEDPPYG